MDADLQHDENLLPRMFEVLRNEPVDIVIGSRFLTGRHRCALPEHRRMLSRLGNRLARLVTGADLADPMSCYFMFKRSFFDAVAPRLSARGFKLLIDVLASAPCPLVCKELPFTFRARLHGKSKFNAGVAFEYLRLLLDKLIQRIWGAAVGRFTTARSTLF
jgi:dolichol-phosphate mannosyltransferase